MLADQKKQISSRVRYFFGAQTGLVLPPLTRTWAARVRVKVRVSATSTHQNLGSLLGLAYIRLELG